MNNIIPLIGKKYKVISGVYTGFKGTVVSYDLEDKLPIILQDDNWNSRAVKLEEVEPIEGNDLLDVSRLQKN